MQKAKPVSLAVQMEGLLYLIHDIADEIEYLPGQNPLLLKEVTNVEEEKKALGKDSPKDGGNRIEDEEVKQVPIEIACADIGTEPLAQPNQEDDDVRQTQRDGVKCLAKSIHGDYIECHIKISYHEVHLVEDNDQAAVR